MHAILTEQTAWKARANAFTDTILMHMHIKLALIQSAVRIILSPYYYSTCSSFPGKVLCRSTRQYKYNNTLKSQALAFQVPSYKKNQIPNAFFLNLITTFTHSQNPQTDIWPSVDLEQFSRFQGNLTSIPKVIPYDFEAFSYTTSLLIILHCLH